MAGLNERERAKKAARTILQKNCVGKQKVARVARLMSSDGARIVHLVALIARVGVRLRLSLPKMPQGHTPGTGIAVGDKRIAPLVTQSIRYGNDGRSIRMGGAQK